LTSIKPFDKAFFSFTIMKKIIFFILVFVAVQSFGQNRFPSIDSAKNYSLRYIRNSTVESFTNLRMQNVVYGTLQLLDSLAGAGVIDTIFKSGDTLKYKIGSTTFTVGTYVPYTGATSDVDLNGNSLNAKSLSITGTGGNGHLHMRFQSSTPSGQGNHTTIYADATGIPYYKIDGASPVQIGGTYTAGNGLTLSGSEFQLGGIANSSITIQNTEPNTISSVYNNLTGSIGSDAGIVELIAQSSSKFSTIRIDLDSISIKPHLGRINIDTLGTTTDTANFKPAVHNPVTGQFRRMTSWPSGGGIPSDTSTSINNRINLRYPSDTSLSIGNRFLNTVQLTGNQTVNGRKTFNAATFINKDSLPITTGKLWHVVVDTPTNQLMRQQVTAGGITGSGSANRITYWDGASSVTSNANLTTNGSNLGIGGTANSSAALDVTSTTQGARPFPTMTTTQRNAISSPATGLLIFNSTDSVQQYYNGATWIDLSDYRLSRRVSNKYEYVNDFLNLDIFTASSSGGSAGAGAGTQTNNNLTGEAYLQIGAVSSTAAINSVNNSNSGTFAIPLVTNPYIFETRLRIDTCSATDTLLFYFAATVTNTSTSTAVGNHSVGFLYDPRNTLGFSTTGNRNIFAFTRQSSVGTQTAVNTNTAFRGINTYDKLKFVVSSTYALFYVNDVLVATITTNLPNDTGSSQSISFRYTKTVGATVLRARPDYFLAEHYFDTKR
jgi:hypothetical protein